MKLGKVIFHETLAGFVKQDEKGYSYTYAEEYLKNPIHGPISQTLPLRSEPFIDEKNMLPFFDGLIPEGFLLDMALKNWKLHEKDRMELLLSVCKDCIGAVSVIKLEDGKE